MATLTKNAPTKQRVQLTLSSDLYDAFEEKGRQSKRSPEEEMATRLTMCRDHTSPTALYIDDKSRQELEAIAGHQMRSARDVVAWARSLATLSVANTTVPLSEQLLKRLDTRRFGRPLGEYVIATTVDLLEKEVGMR